MKSSECIATIAMILVACGNSKVTSPGGSGPEVTDDTHNAYAVATVGELPTCDDKRRGQLFFIEADEKFRVCRSTGWQVINLAEDNQQATSLMDASIFCGGQLQGETIWVNYSASLMKSGDIFVTGSVIGSDFEVSDSAFYARQQNGAATAKVLITFDLAGDSNAGYWALSLDRATLITSVVYNDVDVSGGVRSWTMAPERCVSNDYP